jgi:hypothetical protein
LKRGHLVKAFVNLIEDRSLHASTRRISVSCVITPAKIRQILVHGFPIQGLLRISSGTVHSVPVAVDALGPEDRFTFKHIAGKDGLSSYGLRSDHCDNTC